MSDYYLIEKSKNNDERAKFELWEKYERLIHRTYNQSRSFFQSMGFEREDFVQESYIQFEEAIKNFKLERVKDPEGYSFYSYYALYLKKIKNRVQTEYRRYGSVLYINSEILATDSSSAQESMNPMALVYNEATATNFDDELKKENSRTVVQRYLTTVSPEEREVLELYIADCKIVEIARRLSQTYSETYRIIQRSKRELSTIYMRSALY